MGRLLVGLVAVAIAVSLVATAGAAERFKRHTIRGEGVARRSGLVGRRRRCPSRRRDRKASPREPEARSYLVQRKGGSRAKFLALDPALKGGFATNVNVVISDIPSVTFDVYRAAILSEIGSLVGSAKVNQRTVKIGGVRGVRLSYRLRVTLGRTYTVSALQYGLLRPGKNVVVTYTTLPRLASSYAPTFARSAASIRFG
jgi:hypothetical protein